jgi:hypothetical protein
VIEKIYGIVQMAKQRLACIWDTIYQPVKIGKFGMRWVLRIMILLSCVVIGTSASIIEYAIFYQMIMPISEQTQEVTFMPDDLRPNVLTADIYFDREQPDFVDIS